MAVQRRLPFAEGDDRGLATLIVGEACAPVAASVLTQDARWPRGGFVLIGAHGSGKSHWARAFLDVQGGEAISALGDLSEAAARWRDVGGALAIDDADAVRDEAGLFAILDLAASGHGRVLLTASTPPRAWGVGMRDLASRLEALPRARLDEPDEAMLMALLTRLCRRRFLKLEPAVAQGLARSMERTYDEAHRLAEALDALTANRGRPISAALGARALALINPKADLWPGLTEEPA